MKKFLITIILLALFGTSTTLLAQYQSNESLGLPGDNLNLFAVMKLFQESETLEGFEKNLNAEDSHINNLDLNGDNKVDYIRVIDNIDGDSHTIVLQVAINKRENQDVAVFTVQRNSNGQVQIQLIGDEALYGKDYIIEPNYADSGQTPNPGYMGTNSNYNGQNVTIIRTTPSEIAFWPVIRFIYMPNYVIWRSSWHYNYYPSYWNPWHPYYWDYYYGYQYNWNNDYYEHYRRTQQYRYTRYNDYYYSSRRVQSPVVTVKIQKGNYKSTYSRPDQRKAGEDMYIKTNPGQNARRSDQNSGTNKNSSTARPSTGTNTNSRPANTETLKPERGQTPQQNAGSTRKAPQQNAGSTREAPRQNISTPKRVPAVEQSNSAPVNNSAKSQPSRESGKAASNPKPERSSAPAVKSSTNNSRTNTKSQSTQKQNRSQKTVEPAKPERKN